MPKTKTKNPPKQLIVKEGHDLLVKAVRDAAGVASVRSPNPIVGNLVLRWGCEGDLDGPAIEVRATDFERAVVRRVCCDRVEMDDPGEVCVPARRLDGLLRLIDRSKPLTICETDDGLRIRSGRSTWNLRGQDPADFPGIAEPDPSGAATNLEVEPAARIGEMFDLVSFAIATEKGRYSLNGVRVEFIALDPSSTGPAVGDGGGVLTLIASDGRRLAVAERWFAGFADGPDGAAGALRYSPPVGDWHVIIPRAGVDMIRQLVDSDPGGRLALEIRENQVLATISGERGVGGYCSTQLVAGLYPAFRQVLPDPATQARVAVVPPKALADELHRARQFTSDDQASVAFTFTRNRVTMSSRDHETGAAEAACDCEYVPTDDDDPEDGFVIALEPRYVTDVLRLPVIAARDDLPLRMRDGDHAVTVDLELPAVPGAPATRWYGLIMPCERG